MTTYQRRGGQYQTRSGATAYRRGVKGQRANSNLRRPARRFYRRHTVACLAVGACGLILAWHISPALVLAGAGILAIPYAVSAVRGVKAQHRAAVLHVRRAKAGWAAWQATPVQRAPSPSTLAGRFDSRVEQARAGRGAPVFRTAPPDHEYRPGSPPLFMCGVCNSPHERAAA